MDAFQTLLPFHHLKEKRVGECVSPCDPPLGEPLLLPGNLLRSQARVECQPWSPFNSLLGFHSGDSLLLDDSKPATGMGPGAKRKRITITQAIHGRKGAVG